MSATDELVENSQRYAESFDRGICRSRRRRRLL
jgi:hypothetical protein